MTVYACGALGCNGMLMIGQDEIEGGVFWVHTCSACRRRIVGVAVTHEIDAAAIARLEKLQTRNMRSV